jgi:enoyl-CoA hydratase
MPESSSLLVMDRPRDGVAILILNRAEAKNALSLALRRQFVSAIDELSRSGDVRVLILTGAGDAFCAGLDLKELTADPSIVADREESNPIAALKRFPGVIIGAINGAAITGGFELALACDILIASENARFADTHARVGVLPGWELSQRLSRAIGPYRAKRLALTGQFLEAGQAQAWGIVSEVVPAARLIDHAQALAEALLSASPGLLRAYKAVIDDGYAVSLREGLEIEARRARSHNGQLSPQQITARHPSSNRPGRSDSD